MLFNVLKRANSDCINTYVFLFCVSHKRAHFITKFTSTTYHFISDVPTCTSNTNIQKWIMPHMNLASNSYNGFNMLNNLYNNYESWTIQGLNIRLIILTFHEFNVVCMSGKLVLSIKPG